MPAILGVGGLIVVIVVVVAIGMGGDDTAAKEDDSLRTTSAAPSKSEAEIWKERENGVAAPDRMVSKKGAWKRKPKFDPKEFESYMSQVDMSIWDRIERHFAEARKLKAQALAVRKTGNEAEFKRLIKQAVREWRQGDMMSEDLEMHVERIKENMWDAMFERHQKKIEKLIREFRGYLAYEND